MNIIKEALKWKCVINLLFFLKRSMMLDVHECSMDEQLTFSSLDLTSYSAQRSYETHDSQRVVTWLEIINIFQRPKSYNWL